MRIAGLIAVFMVLGGCEMVEPDYVALQREPDDILAPAWAERTPSFSDMMKVYPEAALDAGIESLVKLPCVVLADWTFACEPGWEEQPGYGFSEAAIRVSKIFAIRKDNSYGVTPGARVTLPIRFVVG